MVFQIEMFVGSVTGMLTKALAGGSWYRPILQMRRPARSQK